MRSAAVIVLLALVMAPATAHAQVRVGSKAFTESRVLCEVIAQLIEARTGLSVERRPGLGGTKIVFAALEKGDIDIYPEYTGTGWEVMLKRTDPLRSPLHAFLEVERAFKARYNLRWLAPFGFNNSYALAMSRPLADELGVVRISDLTKVTRPLRVGLSHEFLERADGYPRIRDTYGLSLEVRGMEHGLAYEALGTGNLDVVDAYTTDGKLLRYDVRVLEDDRQAFPPYDAAPLARADVLERHPEIVEALAAASFRFDDARMREVNQRAEDRGGAFAEVARELLLEEGLIEGSAPPPTPLAQGIDDRIVENRALILKRLLEHIALTAAAVLVAIMVGVPLGIALTRRARAAPYVLGAAGVIQTIPGLAMLAFMIPVPGLGLGVRSAVCALFLYALLPIIRNSFTGIREVDPDLIEAARGMGLRDGQILWRVELPLAIRTVMAGVRTSAVITVGVATLAAFVGAGGLGDLIVTGLQLDDIFLILSGAVPSALLAVIVDGGLGALERRLVPRGLDAQA